MYKITIFLNKKEAAKLSYNRTQRFLYSLLGYTLNNIITINNIYVIILLYVLIGGMLTLARVSEFEGGTWKAFAIKDPDSYIIGFSTCNKNS